MSEAKPTKSCSTCNGRTEPGFTTDTYTRKNSGVILTVKGIPAEICTVCGENYVEIDTLKEIERLMAYIRGDFRLRFGKRAKDAGIKVVDDRILRYPLPFSDDTILASWISEDLKKVMRVQESDDDGDFQFDGFVAKAGLDDEYDDLCVVAVASNAKVKEIFDLYKLWFVENISPEKMEGILENYFERFNKSCSCGH